MRDSPMYLDGQRRSCCTISLNNFSIFADKEFREVPSNTTSTKRCTFTCFKELVHWCCFWSIDAHLLQQIEIQRIQEGFKFSYNAIWNEKKRKTRFAQDCH